MRRCMARLLNAATKGAATPAASAAAAPQPVPGGSASCVHHQGLSSSDNDISSPLSSRMSFTSTPL